ncbi:AAA family ATPase [Thermosipho ferrireducens]|uniref:endopeptidase La n=1 Tax=Thermosipho ferrireducens TaxID=2571116 RepID=A0ABX7S8F5_9BACT|nr:ATP-binding protein [Thermosipho ferrireducens]QTA38183.1 AAA family ATPase [Thermosipho ferrireducens]
MKLLKYEELILPNNTFPKTKTSDQITPCESFIGQKKAWDAINFGLSIDSKGYNIFVVGPSGTGRKSFVLELVKSFAKNKKKQEDLIYVVDLDNPYSAKAIELPAGYGKELKREMSKISEEIFVRLKSVFESDEYEHRKKELEDEYREVREKILKDLQEKALKLGFIVKLTPTGFIYMPALDGKPISKEQYEELPDEKKQYYEEEAKKVDHLISGTLHKLRKVDSNYSEKLKDLDKYASLFAIEEVFEKLKVKYKNYPKLVDYLEKLKDHFINNIEKIKGSEEGKEYIKHMLNINLLVDNSEVQGAPVIFEKNPTYPNLFGKIEYISKLGVLYTDFTMIRGGAIHKANGGYLIINAEEILKYPYVWDKLKKTLLTEKILIENVDMAYGFNPTVSLKPEPVDAKLKIIMVGTPEIYYLLYEYDEDFKKLFKVKVEFDWEIDVTQKNVKEYYSFISSVIKNNQLKPFSNKALQRIIWYSMRLSGSREKLSMKMGEIVNLMVEADYKATLRNAKIVSKKDVDNALEAYENRVSLIREKYDKSLRKYEIMIETDGREVGQVNGLTVTHLGDYSFGLPVKITAKSYVGNIGIIDIQRESDLSGNIHSKAVMTLIGYLGSKYANEIPFSLGVSISFEQVYAVVEGDSASLAETIAIISAISKIPIKQSIAITGSINQHGIVQPIGGVNEKVEGFYRLCKYRGLNGEHGVIIPEANVKNLVLNDEILKDIKLGKFNIWAVKTVDEALEILTELPAGKLSSRGTYPRGSVNYYVTKELRKVYEKLEGKDTSKGKKKKGKK